MNPLFGTYFLHSCRVPRVDDRRAISGTGFVIRKAPLARRSLGLWRSIDYLQTLHPPEASGRLQPDLRSAGGQGWYPNKLMMDDTHLLQFSFGGSKTRVEY